jgi:superfamily II DNA or RNA helicase
VTRFAPDAISAKEQNMLNPTPMKPPHDWQVACLAKYRLERAEGHNEFLIVASVGGGKTRVSLEAAAEMITEGETGRVIVITHTTHLVKQWGREANKYGLNLVQAFGNGDLRDGLPADANGYVCTYASMASWPEIHEAFAHGVRTLVIFDEIHHLADKDETNPTAKVVSVWGDKARKCFGTVSFRLGLSGTPFRTSGDRIPFVRYITDPETPGMFVCDPDFKYLYGNAVADEICRAVIFKPYDADQSASRKIIFKESGMDFNVTFEDQLADEPLENARLWASTHISDSDEIPADLSTCKWPLLVSMFKEADRKLRDLRASDHSNAGGIVFGHTADQVRGAYRLFTRVTKSRAILVLNEDKLSARQLDAFRDGDTPWIFSVRMVSEGVDIPRLRVCVYLSTWRAVTFFLQCLGRIVRFEEFPASPWGESFFYYPKDKRLHKIATAIEDEMKQFLRDKKGPRTGPGGGGAKPIREAIHTEGDERDNIASGSPFASTDIEVADAARRELGLGRISLVELLRFWDRVRNGQRGPAPQLQSTPPSYDEQRDDYRGKAQRLVGRLSNLSGRQYDHIHFEANHAAGIKNTKSATLEQLKAKVVWLREQISLGGADPAIDADVED